MVEPDQERGDQGDDDDSRSVDEESKESFPASDPPSNY